MLPTATGEHLGLTQRTRGGTLRKKWQGVFTNGERHPVNGERRTANSEQRTVNRERI
jgi:hypothetical protein